MKTLILDNRQIQEKIKRLAFQVYEENYTETEIVLAGIAPNGYHIARQIASLLIEISPIQVHLIQLIVNKENPLQSQIQSDKSESFHLDNLTVIVIDDVLNTGKTMIYGINYLLAYPLKKVQTLVLIDRDHKQFPVLAHYIGMALSTNLQEHVTVILNEEMAVYLE
ncbi:MAG: phosphoribosyltransferase [Candidatus Competibacteraceae bacterium]|nr:phosphoribosyltransferase [Candidatus Competibacteraceae bacterium]